MRLTNVDGRSDIDRSRPDWMNDLGLEVAHAGEHDRQ
jgi:hypothetical protein